MGVRLGANLDFLSGLPLASLRRAGRDPWTLEQLLHAAIAAVAILGWSLVYVTLMHGVDPPKVAKDSIGTKISANLASQR